MMNCQAITNLIGVEGENMNKAGTKGTREQVRE
jgi:hypothetical protein